MLTFFVLALATAAFAAPADEAIDRDVRSMFDQIDAPGCGQRPLVANNGAGELISNRIVGGQESVRNSWPALCSLRRASNPSFHMCGSNLVKNLNGMYYLITAAHCVVGGGNARSYIAYCGIHEVSSSATEPNRELIQFNSLWVHPSYDDWTLDYDIAILSLSSQPSTNLYINTICLPNEGWNEGELSIVAGWGTLSAGGSSPAQLQQVVKPIKSKQTCMDRYGAGSITDRMLCAGYPDGGYDSCQGDSGGPLMNYREGRWTLTGIVSWGYGCAEAGRPGVYTDVIQLKQWIAGIIN